MLKRTVRALICVLLIMLCGCEKPDELTQSLGESFAEVTETVIERLNKADADGVEIIYEDYADDADDCFNILSFPDSTEEMRSDAEETLGEIVAHIDLSRDGGKLAARLIEGYLGEANYYCSYERMLSGILGSRLDADGKIQLYTAVLRGSYRVFRPLFEQSFELLGDKGEQTLNAYISDILKGLDGDGIYFEQVYETVCLKTDKQIEEQYGVTLQELESTFTTRFGECSDKDEAVYTLKKTQGVNSAFERIAVFTDIFKSNGADCLGLDTRGIFTVPETESDPSDLVCDAEAKAFMTEYANGEKHENVFIIPKINLDLPGAQELSAQIYDYFLSFNPFFEALGSNVANYDWDGYDMYVSFSYDSDLADGVLTVTVFETGAKLGSQEYERTYVYRYDMANDCEIEG